MTRDDMFSWLIDTKHSRKSRKSSPSGLENQSVEEQENKAMTILSEKGNELELQPAAGKADNAFELSQEDITETLSRWVGSIVGNPQEICVPMVVSTLPSTPTDLHPAQVSAVEISSDDISSGKSGGMDTGETLEPRDEYVHAHPLPIKNSKQALDEVTVQKQDTTETPLSINEQQRILEVLTKARHEPKPRPGMPAMELAPPRFRPARVLAVKAGGRRITARITSVDRIYSYTLRTDKTYRLEGVATKAAPRLILDIEV